MGNALGSCVVFSQSMCEKKPQNNGGAGMILHMHGKHMKTPKSDFNARKGSASNPNLLKGRNKSKGAVYKSKVNFNKVGM
jgi:hypothetical protein